MLHDLSRTGSVFLTEIRSGLRDRHVVIYSLILPIFLYPALILLMFQGIQYREGALERQIARIAWEGTEHFPAFADSLAADERFSIVESADPAADLIDGNLDAHLQIGEDDSLGARVIARFDLSRDRSVTARDRLHYIWEHFRRKAVRDRLAEDGVARSVVEVLDVREENIASAAEMGRFLLSRLLPLVLVIMLSMGALYPAVDVLVGEKERGTLESLLAAGVPRLSIVAGKFLTVVAASFSALVANLFSMVLTLRHQAQFLEVGGKGLSIGIPWSAVPIIVVGGLLLAAFISASMILIASFARTFKEGQGYLTPFYVATMVPALAGIMPAIELTPTTALIPLTNVALLFRSALLGSFPLVPIVIVFLSLILYLTATLALAARVFGKEDFFLGGGLGWRAAFRLPFLSRGGS